MRLVENKGGYFFQIDNEMVDIWLRILKPSSFIVYCVLVRMTNEKGSVFPNVSQPDWAQYCGVSASTFQASIKELKKYNLIEVRPPKGRDKLQHKPTIYILNRLDEVVIRERDIPEPFPTDCAFIDPIYEFERIETESMFRTIKERDANKVAGLVNFTSSKNLSLLVQYIRKNNIIKCNKYISVEETKNKVVRKRKRKTTTTKKQSSPETKIYSSLTKQLIDIVETNFGRSLPNNINTALWTTQFRLLHTKDGIPLKKIEEVMEWYEEYAGMEYIPECQSGGAFRIKFDKLENALFRTTKQKRNKKLPTGMQSWDKYDDIDEIKIVDGVVVHNPFKRKEEKDA